MPGPQLSRSWSRLGCGEGPGQLPLCHPALMSLAKRTLEMRREIEGQARGGASSPCSPSREKGPSPDPPPLHLSPPTDRSAYARRSGRYTAGPQESGKVLIQIRGRYPSPASAPRCPRAGQGTVDTAPQCPRAAPSVQGPAGTVAGPYQHNSGSWSHEGIEQSPLQGEPAAGEGNRLVIGRDTTASQGGR